MHQLVGLGIYQVVGLGVHRPAAFPSLSLRDFSVTGRFLTVGSPFGGELLRALVRRRGLC